MRAYLEGELGSAHSRGTSNTTLPPRDAPAASSSVARGEEERHADEGKRGAKPKIPKVTIHFDGIAGRTSRNSGRVISRTLPDVVSSTLMCDTTSLGAKA